MPVKVYTLRVPTPSQTVDMHDMHGGAGGSACVFPVSRREALKSPRLPVDSSFEYTRHVSGAKIIPFAGRCGLRFGVYLGGPCEVHHELATGKPDVPEEINRVLDILQSENPFLVRTYLGFTGTHDDAELVDMPSMPDLARYTWRGRNLDRREPALRRNRKLPRS